VRASRIDARRATAEEVAAAPLSSARQEETRVSEPEIVCALKAFFNSNSLSSACLARRFASRMTSSCVLTVALTDSNSATFGGGRG
jgi:hypothetical protein